MKALIKNDVVIISRKPLAKKRRHFENIELSIMCIPAVLLIFVLNYIPMGGIFIAFKDFRVDKGIFGSDWNGFSNFKYFFTSQDAWIILRNTIGINLLSISIGLIVSVFLALLMNEITSKIMIKTYQTIMFFPYFLSWVIVAYMLYSFLCPQYGIINNVLQRLGVAPIQWYIKPEYWTAILTFAAVWKGMGYGTVIYYAAILGIDGEYYEAALIDGASKFQMMRKITIPLLVPLIVVNTLLQIGRILNADFGLFFFLPMGSGMLYSTTTVIDTYVYNALVSTGDVGIGAATGLFQSAVGLILILLANYAAKRISRENSLF